MIQSSVEYSKKCTRDPGTPATLSWLPPAPPGYETYIKFDTIRSNPLHAYQAIIQALCILAIQPWDGHLSSAGLDVTIGELVVVVDTQDKARARVSHAIRGLVEMLVDMRAGKPGFFYGGCRILIRGKAVALVGIAPAPDAQISAIPNNASIDRPLNAAAGWHTITTPQLLRPGSKIVWRYTDGTIPAQELLSTFVDAVGTAAQHDSWTNCDYVDAVGPSQSAAFHMNTLGSGGLRWMDVSGTIQALVAQAIIPSKRFAEIEWELWVSGTKRAFGDVLKLNTVAQPSTGGATSTS
ncbi:MAG: hypothetical protein Q9203_000393 [Teloschistes exilis]